jgi:hypothetical protein
MRSSLVQARNAKRASRLRQFSIQALVTYFNVTTRVSQILVDDVLCTLLSKECIIL